ncbi:MAG TPA: hypothetical protein VL094_06375 [Sphingomonadaceae bacterium]|nr:hypothetical protein [Sphingomonadaceae bacterium]
MNKAIRILPALASMLLLGAAPGPKLIGEFDLAQMRELVEDMGYIWVSGYVADDASPRAVIEARDGPKLQIALRSTECTKEGGQWYCTAFQITPANPPFVAAGDLAAYARSLNDSQSFTRVHPNSMTFFNQKTIEPVTYVSLGGGVTAANIQAHIRMYTRLAIGAYGLGETPQGGGAIQTASGLAPGLYSYSMRARTLNNSGTFCIDRSKKDDNLGRIIAQQISGSNGCTGSAPNRSSVSLSCHGSIADSTLGVTTGSTSYRFSGDIILETDGLGGRERVFIEGHANRVGGC